MNTETILEFGIPSKGQKDEDPGIPEKCISQNTFAVPVDPSDSDENDEGYLEALAVEEPPSWILEVDQEDIPPEVLGPALKNRPPSTNVSQSLAAVAGMLQAIDASLSNSKGASGS